MPDSFATPWTVTCQAPLSMRFPRQEYWGGLPFPSPGDLPDPGIKPVSPALEADSLPLSHQESATGDAHVAKSLQPCLTLCNPTDCSPPRSSVQGLLQARLLEWVAMPSSRGSSQPRDRTHISYVSSISRQVLPTRITWEAHTGVEQAPNPV